MMSLSAAATLIAARSSGADVSFDSVFSDSRAIERSGLFVALRGERFDGHAFVAEVIAQGAAAAMVDEHWATHNADSKLPILIVADTKAGLGQLAAAWRKQFSLSLIGITGSNGKTTVKDLCAIIMAAQVSEGNVLATSGNLNNDIGLPLTLLQLRDKHRAAVIEMGMNHAGEISCLTRIARPTVALVNNAQRAHLEGLGSIEAVAHAKGEIFEGLGQGGIAVLNADDSNVAIWRDLTVAHKTLSFGLDQAADVSAVIKNGNEITLRTPAGNVTVFLQIPGRHNVMNALAASAACLAAGASLDAVVSGLTTYRGAKGRLQEKAGLRGAKIIDDSYNANPDSMRAAVDVLAQRSGKRVFVMGDMGEVGISGHRFHEEIGRYAKSRGIDRLLCLGSLSVAAADNFGRSGEHFACVEELIDSLRGQIDAGTTVLVKGSRFMRMERVVNALLEDKGEPHAA